jgi:hypothetical protein
MGLVGAQAAVFRIVSRDASRSCCSSKVHLGERIATSAHFEQGQRRTQLKPKAKSQKARQLLSWIGGY